MKKKDLLKKILALEAKIKALEAKSIEPIWPIVKLLPTAPTSYLQPLCPLGGFHEYDTAWRSISPQPCKKCGFVIQEPTIIYYSIPATTTICANTITPINNANEQTLTIQGNNKNNSNDNCWPH